jgi:plastocyanin
MDPMQHAQSAASPGDPGVNASPAASTATTGASSSPSNANDKTASATATASTDTTPATPGAATSSKGTLSGSITSTPAAAAKNAVVYLENGPQDKTVTGTLDNRQMTFVPHVLVVTAGAKVTFSNSDPFPHNVFSPDNEKWDMGMIPAHGVRVRRFEKSGVYTVLCNVHPNMKAYILVVPSSHFAKADKNGAYSISDVPAGKYKLAVWAPGVKSEQQETTIDGDKTLSFELHR